MEALLTLIVVWLSANFTLPENYEHPKVVLVAADKMQAERLKAAGAQQPAISDFAATPTPQVEAFYHDATQTIYLPRNWTGNTPGQLSVLVHEMVHHLQRVAGFKYACPQEREKVAYLAQDRWLDQFGSSLIDEFDLDAMSVLVRTRCFY